MRVMAITVFWICVFLVGYTYVLYPLVVRLLARFKANPPRRGPQLPSVSLIIAAYNEEKTIADKLENTLRLDYPREKLDIIVIADGSSDRTTEIVRRYEDKGVRLMFDPPRRGKSMALNRAAAEAKSDILFFSDANTFYNRDAVRMMVRNFSDPKVGGVSGRKIVMEDDEREASAGETAYWGYETSLKQWESDLGSIATADGEMFAVRRVLFTPIPRDVVHDDMFLTLSIIDRGYRVVFDGEALSAEYASKTLKDEFQLKIRYASAGFQILSKFRRLFIPPRGWFAVGFVSHKVLRWLVPFFLIGALISSALANMWLYWVFFVLQVSFYLCALAGYLLSRGGSGVGLLYFPMYFTVMNAAAGYGFVRHFFGGGQTTNWHRAER